MKKLIAFVVVVLFIVGMVSVSMLPGSQESEEAVFLAISTKTISTTPTKWFSCAAQALDNEWYYYPGFAIAYCNNKQYVGNYGVGAGMNSPSFKVVPHQGIIVSLNLMLLDSWDGESFYVKADDQVVYSYQWIEKKAPSKTCGYRWKDAYPAVTFGFNHTASTVSFAFYSTLDQDNTDESWGVCDFTVTASQYPVTYEGKLVFDLIETATTYFPCANMANANNWYYKPGYTTINCNGNNYLGAFGVGAYIASPALKVAPHQGIIVSLKLALLDAWHYDNFQFKVDGVLVYWQQWFWIYSNSNTCGGRYQDGYPTLKFGFNHTASTVSFVLTSNLQKVNSDGNPTWGVCDLTISTSPYPVTLDGQPITPKTK